MAALEIRKDRTPAVLRKLANLKTVLRKAQERRVDDVIWRIAALLPTVLPRECANYLSNAGYAST